MKQVISTEKKPIKLWLDDIENGALDQAKNLANLPFTFKHVALMPDAHQGYGMPIGGVFATNNVIVPNAVGMDIGCGICAVKTSIRGSLDQETLRRIIGGSKEYPGGIRSSVPVGFSHHSKKQNDCHMPRLHEKDTPIAAQEYESALKYVGTLGGGNHFIEIQKGSDGYIWLMVHSGSRAMGAKVAQHYNHLANAANRLWNSEVPKKWELAFLPINSDHGTQYMNEMQYCVKFAFANRLLIMQRVMDAVTAILPRTRFATEINVAHNYAAIEHHYGANVVVHRKGATRARNGEWGIIPGSQGTKSYIVTGKGNPESFTSCSHGAGRVLSRTKAIKTLNFDAERALLDDQGIIHNMNSSKSLDEAPGAYKDITAVMANQEDLVNIAVELTPLAVIKG